jgi:DNA-binding NarL/FixJ family response regulator
MGCCAHTEGLRTAGAAGVPGSVARTRINAPKALPMSLLRTFIVEDSALIRENLIATLEELVSLQVVGTAEDEASAVRWLAQPENPIDLVIIDIFLKAGSGLGVLRAAGLGGPANPNETSGPPKPKMVVLSNYATADLRRKCLDLGADRVFDKSNDIEALLLYCGRLAAGGTGETSPGALLRP